MHLVGVCSDCGYPRRICNYTASWKALSLPRFAEPINVILVGEGQGRSAVQALWALSHLASLAIYLNGNHLGPAVRRFPLHCQELRAYLANNERALIDYGARAGRPISTSRAEASVDEIANTRMAKRRRMRWSPRGAHCVAIVRAAVLDDRLHLLTSTRLAA